MPAALVAAFSYDRKVLLERYVDGRELAVSVLDGADGEPPLALPIVEAVPEQDDVYDFAARYEIGRTASSARRELDEPVTARVQEIALAGVRAARLLAASPAST